jgi:transketolase
MTIEDERVGGGPDALKTMAVTMRRWIIEQSLASNVGHVASALSVVDIVAVLWGAVMRRAGTTAVDRDRFILAKGHASLALYGAMRFAGLLDQRSFETYCRDGSRLAVHPDASLSGVDLSTGSLGQGLSVGAGCAYGLRLRGQPSRVFVLMSDGECNEGQVWEAAQFAAHHRLDRLIAVIDCNGLQALGCTKDIVDLEPVAEKWRAFGWQAMDVDGHDLAALTAVLTAPPAGRPRMVVARTVQGKGVSFMEGRLEWHYRNLSPELAAQALGEIQRQG